MPPCRTQARRQSSRETGWGTRLAVYARAKALAAARALLVNTDLAPSVIVQRALEIAADICVYTNRNITVLDLG